MTDRLRDGIVAKINRYDPSIDAGVLAASVMDAVRPHLDALHGQLADSEDALERAKTEARIASAQRDRWRDAALEAGYREYAAAMDDEDRAFRTAVRARRTLAPPDRAEETPGGVRGVRTQP